MKIQIIFSIKKEPTGGGNQFLKTLKKYFIEAGIYTENSDEADIFLFNSYQYISEVLELKKAYPNKFFVHRIDGPIRLYSQMTDKRDVIINLTNKLIADATIFQSEWSKNQNFKLGLEKNKQEIVIPNAPDSTIFNRNNKHKFEKNRKLKIIATSWSAHYKKGFAIYEWLDANFDFNKIEMTFVGNTQSKFKHIKHIKPLSSKKLAEQLKKHDIFITASQKDPCSNSLIEALHCGLPAIALNDGGHPEIIKNAGEIFNKKEEIIELTKKIAKNYENYVENINCPKIEEVAEKYIQFLQSVLKNKKTPKKVGLKKQLKIKIEILKQKTKSELKKHI